MSEPVWLGAKEVALFHQLIVQDSGGDSGLRDWRKLEAAVMRARNAHSYGGATWSKMAAAYAAGIIQGMPFLDGNKRAGLAAAAVFLELNGRKLIAPEPEAVVQVLGLAAGEISEATFARWIDSRIVVDRVEETVPPRRAPKARPAARKTIQSPRRR